MQAEKIQEELYSKSVVDRQYASDIWAVGERSEELGWRRGKQFGPKCKEFKGKVNQRSAFIRDN